MYLANWKEALPVGEVHALPAGRKPFQPARMCLAGYVRIPAQAGGYPPEVAVAGADGASP
jgi:hypothetical protein